MRTGFKVYKRKIHVWYWNEKEKGFFYAWPTNAFKTCREALADAKRMQPHREFKACFAKD
jgi:hypothetical protein